MADFSKMINERKERDKIEEDGLKGILCGSSVQCKISSLAHF